MRGTTAIAQPRRPLDKYTTPDALALACCRVLDEVGLRPESVIDAGCGGGAFLRAIKATWPRALLTGVDVSPECDGPGDVYAADFIHGRFGSGNQAVISNPPYDRAEAFVRRAIELVRPGGYVAFLLRLSFLASQERIGLYRKHPVGFLWPIAGRPSFTGDGKTDGAEYGLVVWTKLGRGPGQIRSPITWKGT